MMLPGKELPMPYLRLLALVAIVFLIEGCEKQPPNTTSQPASAPATGQAKTGLHPPPPAGWVEVACQPGAGNTFDVTAFVEHGTDVETYLSDVTPDKEVEWGAKKDFKVLEFSEKHTRQGGYTDGAFPTAKGKGHTSGKFKWNKMPLNSAPDKCWEFKATFEYDSKKYDPHTVVHCCT